MAELIARFRDRQEKVKNCVMKKEALKKSLGVSNDMIRRTKKQVRKAVQQLNSMNSIEVNAAKDLKTLSEMNFTGNVLIPKGVPFFAARRLRKLARQLSLNCETVQTFKRRKAKPKKVEINSDVGDEKTPPNLISQKTDGKKGDVATLNPAKKTLKNPGSKTNIC